MSFVRVAVALGMCVIGIDLAGCKGTSNVVPRQYGAVRTQTGQAPQFRAIPLPTSFIPIAIMSDGQIVGSSRKSAAIYANGTIKLLGSYKGAATFATSVNASGRAVGYAQFRKFAPQGGAALEFNNGHIYPLTHVAHCLLLNAAAAIDEVGDIYGTCWDRSQGDEPSVARFAPGRATYLSPGDRGYITSVSKSGDFALSECNLGNCSAYRGRGLKDYPLKVDYGFTSSVWINDYGAIAGAAGNGPFATPPFVAFVYPLGGPVQFLPSPPLNDDIEPAGINKSGQVVGRMNPGTFFYSAGVLHDITNLIQPAGAYAVLGSPWQGSGLSNAGDFLASIARSDGTTNYYLVRPIYQGL